MIDFSALPALAGDDYNVTRALAFARAKHVNEDGSPILREFSGVDYVDGHLVPVASLLQERFPALRVAAVLHDTLEDTKTTDEELRDAFGMKVADIVRGLSHAFSSEQYPTWGRAARKGAEAGRLYQLGFGPEGFEIHTIKAADIAHNAHSIAAENPSFARVYLKEKHDVLAVLHAADPALRALALATVREAAASIGLAL